MTGKTVLITGASAGIGKATASELAARGARIALLCRDPAQGRERPAPRSWRGRRMRRSTCLRSTCASLASVRACAKSVLDAYPRVDVLVNNAGVFPPTLRHTADGFEEQIGVNHLGHFLLTKLLLERLRGERACARRERELDDARGRRDRLRELPHAGRSTARSGAYRQSKLANILFSNELARRVPAAESLPTRCTRVASRPRSRATRGCSCASACASSGRAPRRARGTSVQLASAPELEDTTGKYFVSGREKAPDPAALDAGLAKRLWDESAKLVGLG